MFQPENIDTDSTSTIGWILIITIVTGTIGLSSYFLYSFYLISKIYPFDCKVNIPKKEITGLRSVKLNVRIPKRGNTANNGPVRGNIARKSFLIDAAVSESYAGVRRVGTSELINSVTLAKL